LAEEKRLREEAEMQRLEEVRFNVNESLVGGIYKKVYRRLKREGNKKLPKKRLERRRPSLSLEKE